MQTYPRSLTSKSEWLIPAVLILLSVIPVIAGAFRVVELSRGAEVTPANARFFASPLPVVLHIVGVTLYSLLGAFQFAPGFRRRHRRWHRAAGRVLIPAGLTAALSGLWMAHFYPWPAYDGELLYGLRLLFGTMMVVSLVLGTEAIRRRDFVRHGAWMLRAYAIGMGAGTQVLTLTPFALVPSLQSEFVKAVCMGVGWMLNLVIAEWLIRQRLVRPRHTSPAAFPSSSQTHG